MPAGLKQGGGARLGGRGSWLFWIATLLLVTAALVSVRRIEPPGALMPTA